MARRSSTLLTLLLVMTAVLLAGPSAARWSRPHELERGGWSVFSVRAAASPSGWSAVVWHAQQGLAGPQAIKLRFIRPDGSRTPITRVSYSASEPYSFEEVGLDRRGDAVVAWTRFDSALQLWQSYARRVSQGGSRGPVRHVSSTRVNALDPVFVVAPRGRALFATGPFDDPARSGAILTVHNRLLPGPHLSTPGGYGVGTPMACPDGTFAGLAAYDGDLVVTRISRHLRMTDRVLTHGFAPQAVGAVGACDVRENVQVGLTTFPAKPQPNPPAALWAVTQRPGGARSPIRKVSGRHQNVWAAQVAADGSGHAELTWVNPAHGTWQAHVRRWSHVGTLAPAHRLGRTGIPPAGIPTFPVAPAVAVNGHGRGVVAWTRPRESDTTRFDFMARAIRRDGSVGPRRLVGRSAAYASLAGLPDGRARLFYQGHGLLVRTGP